MNMAHMNMAHPFFFLPLVSHNRFSHVNPSIFKFDMYVKLFEEWCSPLSISEMGLSVDIACLTGADIPCLTCQGMLTTDNDAQTLQLEK